MLNVSIIIPAWNEEERIADCLMNATRQTVAPHEVIVVNNRSTDRTCDIVEQFQRDHPEAPVILLQQNEDQGLIPTRNFGLNAATGDVLGRIDADCMLKPDWVEVVSGIFTEDPDAMGATGPVVYYDMPAKGAGARRRRPHPPAHVPGGQRSGAAVRFEHGDSRLSMARHLGRGLPRPGGRDARGHRRVAASAQPWFQDGVLTVHDLRHLRTAHGHVLRVVPPVHATVQEHIRRTSRPLARAPHRAAPVCALPVAAHAVPDLSAASGREGHQPGPRRSGSTSRSSSSRAISTIPSRWTPSNDVG